MSLFYILRLRKNLFSITKFLSDKNPLFGILAIMEYQNGNCNQSGNFVMTKTIAVRV